MQNLIDLIERACRTWPDRPVLLDETGVPLSYAGLGERILVHRRHLSDLGVAKGQRVGLLSKNSPEQVAAIFAVMRAGACLVPLNYSLEARDLAEMLTDGECKFLICERNLEGKADHAIGGRDVAKIILEEVSSSGFGSSRDPDVRPDDLAFIVYTSGSTDRPLGVMLSHRNLSANNIAIAQYMRLRDDDRVHCVLPFYYIYGLSLLLSHIAAGGAVILDNRFLYPQVVVEAMEACGATGFAGVSSHYHILLRQTDFAQRPLKTIRYFQHAGDKMPPALALELAKIFPKKELYLMYGQTEASPRISYLEPARVTRKPASAGQAIPGVELKIMGDSGRECLQDEQGEVAVRGENVMMGYWNSPAETRKALKDGWLYTGDMGFKDAEGDLFVTGRKKQFLKVGGRRISPLEIEAVTLDYDGVLETAVIGIPDGILGQRVKVFVVPETAAAFDSEKLMQFYKKRLPSYKVPSEISVCVCLPKNAQGKIDKKKLMKAEKTSHSPDKVF